MALREAEGWDETDELSLLVVLRQKVGRELRLVYAARSKAIREGLEGLEWMLASYFWRV